MQGSCQQFIFTIVSILLDNGAVLWSNVYVVGGCCPRSYEVPMFKQTLVALVIALAFANAARGTIPAAGVPAPGVTTVAIF